MFRSALLILSGNAASSMLLLIRNLVIARLISVEDYGIAATYAIAMAVVEMASQLGLQQQIVQSKEGDDPRFQRALQGFQVLRGVIAGAVLFLAAGWIADFLRVPHLAWAYQLIAIVPVLTALQHFDIHRLHRQMRFWPMVLTGAVPALISLAAVWPLNVWFGDHRVMLYAILIQFWLMMVVSHLVAERRYGLVFDTAIMARSLAFGWPLLVNGILLFAVFQGDKLIVGRELGLEVLAILAMGVTLTLTPTLVMAKSAQNFFLPQLSKTEDPARFAHLAQVTLQVSLVNGTLLVLGIVAVGGPFVLWVLGDKYSDLVPLLTWLAILQGLRVFKAGPSVVALSQGHSGNAMWANLVRVATLPVVWWVVQQGGALEHVIWVATAGEVAGFALALWLMRARARVSLRPMLAPMAATALFLACAAASAWWGMHSLPQGLLAAALLLVPATFMALMMTDLRMYIARRTARTT